jgi:hypothetical protein
LIVFTDLRTWPTRRWVIAAGIAAAAFIVLAAGYWPLTSRPDGMLWLTVATTALGSAVIGAIVSSYIGTPIGADATLCDTRWPALGMIALYLTTEVRSLEPLVSGPARPVLAAAALALLVWALRERLSSERRAGSSGSAEGEACATCRPLFRHSGAVSSAPIALPPTSQATPTGQDTQP